MPADVIAFTIPGQPQGKGRRRKGPSDELLAAAYADHDPVFTSVGQALHVSWLMEILPVTQKVSTQVLIDSIKQQLGKVEARVSSTINMGGISPLEFRGQCALVRGACENHLPAPELAAIRCRFGHNEGPIHTQATGMVTLAMYLRPRVQVDPSALLSLVGNQYIRTGQRDRQARVHRPSLREIHEETGISTQTLRTALEQVRIVGGSLEKLAHDRLQEIFERTGLIQMAMA